MTSAEIPSFVNLSTAFSAGSAAPLNGKNLVRAVPGGVVNTNEPQYMYVAVPNATGGSGVVDVINIAGAGVPRIDTNNFHAGIQSIPAPNVSTLIDYWRQ